jgi:hypothetical protein
MQIDLTDAEAAALLALNQTAGYRLAAPLG